MSRKLDADERPRNLYTAAVTGKGQFPFDMLRYDSCWPRSEMSDSSKLAINRHDGERYFKESRTVHLLSYHPFTPVRWQSFGWTCKEE